MPLNQWNLKTQSLTFILVRTPLSFNLYAQHKISWNYQTTNGISKTHFFSDQHTQSAVVRSAVGHSRPSRVPLARLKRLCNPLSHCLGFIVCFHSAKMSQCALSAYKSPLLPLLSAEPLRALCWNATQLQAVVIVLVAECLLLWLDGAFGLRLRSSSWRVPPSIDESL